MICIHSAAHVQPKMNPVYSTKCSSFDAGVTTSKADTGQSQSNGRAFPEILILNVVDICHLHSWISILRLGETKSCWTCHACKYTNFPSRNTCNRCSRSKVMSFAGVGVELGWSDVYHTGNAWTRTPRKLAICRLLQDSIGELKLLDPMTTNRFVCSNCHTEC